MKQHEAVIEVMKANGGYATLVHLYQHALSVPNVVWNTKTPFASIRRIVQTRDEFVKIRPGLWALKEYLHLLPAQWQPQTNLPIETIAEYDHTFYQGLLVQIGNLRKYRTYVPAQDKNREFLNSTLAQIITAEECYPFGYPHMVNRARTVDVTWFNERKMPEVMFEVEHTTDIQNSLLKYVELQDFNIFFFIVANTVRKAEFEKKLAFEAFRPIHSRVKFLSYDQLPEQPLKHLNLA